MEHEYLTDKQLDLVLSFEQQFTRKGTLSDRQLEILESINKQAGERDRPLQRFYNPNRKA